MPDVTMLVSEADTLVHLVPPTVSPEARLPDLVRAAAGDPAARTVFVVDAGGRLLGVVAVPELDRDMLTLIIPNWGAEHLSGRQLSRLAQGLDITARKLMREPATVGLSDTVADALEAMNQRNIESAAVLDDDGGLLGYLALFEILAEVVVGLEPVAAGS